MSALEFVFHLIVAGLFVVIFVQLSFLQQHVEQLSEKIFKTSLQWQDRERKLRLDIAHQSLEMGTKLKRDALNIQKPIEPNTKTPSKPS